MTVTPSIVLENRHRIDVNNALLTNLSRRSPETFVAVTSVTSERLSTSLGLFERSIGEDVEGIRTTQEKEGVLSLSGVMGVIGDMLPLKYQ